MVHLWTSMTGDEDMTPLVLLNSSAWLDRANVKLHHKQDLASTINFIESTWKQIYPEGIYNSTFLEDALAKEYALELLVFKAVTTFSILTIFIGCLGVYGLLAFVAIRRMKEV